MQLFDRFATYNGSSPYKTPAAFNIIPYVEARFGGWYVKGGLYEIARALERVCRELGVKFQIGMEVTACARAAVSESARGIRPSWLVTTREESPPLPPPQQVFDIVVCNQDVLSATPRFLPGFAPGAGTSTAPPSKADPAISGFVMYLGVDKSFPELEHHNIFFSDDYPTEFRQLFDDRLPADEPTIYVALHSKDDPGRAPPGCENWFVLVNAPALTDGARVNWPAITQAYGDRILERLETRFGLDGLRQHIRVRQHFTPMDFQTRYLAHRGSLYGFASHGVRAAFQRPAMRPPGTEGFYFVGGSTHPGGGLPLVCLSGRMAADHLLRQLGRDQPTRAGGGRDA